MANSLLRSGRPVPQRLRQMRPAAWRGVFQRAAQGFTKNNGADLAAGLTYYGVLAVFPSAIVVVALVNLVADGNRTVDTIVGLLRDLGAGSVVDQQLRDLIQNVVASRSGAGALLSFGLVGALWSASGYVGGYTRASSVIYGVQEGRPFWKLRPQQLLITAMSLLLMALVVVILIVSGPVTDAVGNALGIGETARTWWSVLKWPALVLIAMVMLAMLAWLAPNVQPPRFRWLTVGGIVSLLAVAVVSFGFGLYVANFGSYDRTYGTLGGVIAFLGWLYLVNGAVLFGVEINAELQRGRALQAGLSAGDPVLPPREAADSDHRNEATSERTRTRETPPSSALNPGVNGRRARREAIATRPGDHTSDAMGGGAITGPLASASHPAIAQVHDDDETRASMRAAALLVAIGAAAVLAASIVLKARRRRA